MLGQGDGGHRWKGNGPAAGHGLGRAGDELAVDLGHRHPAMQQIDPLGPQADQLAPAQATIGGHQDKRPIAGVDGAGQGGDLGHGGKAHLWRPLLGRRP